MSVRGFKIGLVGAGGVVENLHLPVLLQIPGVTVSWLCDKNGKRAAEVAKRFGVRDCFEDISECSDVDVALVAIPVGHRGPIFDRCIARGWHVFSEKPFTVTLAEADRCFALAAGARRQLGVGLMRRQYRATRLAARLIEARTFGDVLEVWAGEGAPMRGTGRADDWYQTNRAASGGGVLIETGSHLVDQVFQILGVRDLNLERYEEISHDGIDDDARVSATVHTATQRDIPVRFFLSRVAEVPNGIRIRCANATLAMTGNADSGLRLLSPEGVNLVASMDDPVGVVQAYPAFHREWTDFLAQCSSETPGLMDATLARPSIDLIDQCYRRDHGRALKSQREKT